MELPEFYKKCMLSPRGQFAVAFTILTSWQLELLDVLKEDLQILQNMPAAYHSGYDTTVRYIMHEAAKYNRRGVENLQGLVQRAQGPGNTIKNSSIQVPDSQEPPPLVAYFAIPSSDRAVLSGKVDMKINPDIEKMHSIFKKRLSRVPNKPSPK
eukprot:1337324-Rhodomonas_salina.1